MANASKRVLVTGGAGFLGSHLCDRLITQGHEVLCLDNLFTGCKRNVEHLLDCPRFEWIRHDVIHPIFLEVDWVFNLACPASPIHYQQNPIKTIKTSVLGALNMLGLAKRVGARILQASTSEVYGDPEIHPQSESYWGRVNPVGKRACYDEGKRCAEALCIEYHRANYVDIRIARIFNTYGPRMAIDDGRVVSNFIVQALRGEPLTVYGDGSQTRSFCYVDDLIDGLLRLMKYEGPECEQPHNLGNPEEFTIRQLAELVRELVGTNTPVSERALPSDDPKQRRPDLSRTRRNLGWEPKIPLREGLRQTIADFRSRLGLGA
jgi:UDP-glucuronate decarboxylase